MAKIKFLDKLLGIAFGVFLSDDLSDNTLDVLGDRINVLDLNGRPFEYQQGEILMKWTKHSRKS